MRMMPRRVLLLAGYLALLALAAPAIADTIVLEDGTRIEGRIALETEDAVVIDVPVTATITDRQTVARSEISSIEKQAPDKAAWQQLSKLEPPPSSLSMQPYDEAIDKLGGFVESFPESTHIDAARQLLERFESERERIESGDVKLDGEWIPASEAVMRSEEISARKQLLRMRELAGEGNMIGALNVFDRIRERAADQPAYPEAAALALTAARRLESQLPQLRAGLKRYQREFEQGLAITPDHEQPALKAAAEERQNEYDAAIDRALDAGALLPPLIPRSERSLDEVGRILERVLPELESIDGESMRQSLQLVDSAGQRIAAGELEQADELLERAAELWQSNARIAEVREELETARAAAEEAEPEEASGQPAAGQEQSADSGADEAAAAASEADDEPAAAASEAGDEPAAGAEEAAPFYLTIPGVLAIIGALVVLLLVVSALARKKPRAGGEES